MCCFLMYSELSVDNTFTPQWPYIAHPTRFITTRSFYLEHKMAAVWGFVCILPVLYAVVLNR